MTTQPTTDPTHGLSVQHADALWDAVAIPGPTEPTFPMQHERVCRAVADILAELTPTQPVVPVSSPPPDQTALRDRIAEALWAANGPSAAEEANVDAVLAVLPTPADRTAMNAAQSLLLRAADLVTERASDLWAPDSKAHAEMLGDAAELRRLAAEAQQPDTETQACAHSDGCDGECPCLPSCGCCTVTAAPGTEMPNTDRAAVYREVADRLTTDAHGMQPDWARIYKRDAAVKVREWAEQLDGEGRQDDAETRP